MPFIFRQALPADSIQIAVLYRQLVNNPVVDVLPERVAELAADEDTALFVCEHHEIVVATALVALCKDVMFRAQPFAVVENVVVDEACRGQGIGAALLRQVDAFCLSKNCSKIMLLSSAYREDAHRFFERAGFVAASKRGFVKYRSAFQAV
ncbi:GNAT family N-acetyltransferase [Uliginosibacterium gangwonense]|uniref:GNAT family N-acetyltransferase n=1 Tax=Uliginosibacterium gangwonense TaxID=392736 RepID=UPI0003705310|nr:GNAT family N-acetyltransferase [Uliginosibacterium gangwonense]